MRDIRFRAWIKPIQIFANRQYGYMIDVSVINFEEKWVSDDEGTVYEFHEIELMQYIGLKDKKGVEIYEEDILKRTYLDGMFGRTHIGEVVYDKEYARYVINKPQKYTEPKTEDIRNTLSDRITYEVIGNIHNNPDLLGRTNL